MLRTLALLRSLSHAYRSLEEAKAAIQQASDYRWLCARLPQASLLDLATALEDGTPALALGLAIPATAERLAGGHWPASAEAREGCLVVGGHACRAAGAPGYRTLESLSQGLVHGAAAVITDRARFHYLQGQQALTLRWRRPERLPAPLARRLLAPGGTMADGYFLLELRVPGRESPEALDGRWLDEQLDRYRRILPAEP